MRRRGGFVPFPPRRREHAMIAKPLVLAGLALVSLAGMVEATPAAQSDSAATWQVEPSQLDGRSRVAFEANLDPNTRSEDSVIIRNLGDESLSLNLVSADIVKTPSGDLTLAADDAPSLAADWVTLTADEVTLEPMQAAEVQFSIAPPANAEPGDYAVAIVASHVQAASGSDGQQAVLEARVGARLYLRVLGDLRSELEISDLIVSRDAPWWNPLPVPASTDFVVTNVGNVRLDASAVVTLKGPFGLELGRTPARDLPQLLPGDSLRLSETTNPATATSGPAVVAGIVAPFLLTTVVEIEATEVSTGQSFVYTVSTSTVDVPWVAIAIVFVLVGRAVVRITVPRRRRLRVAVRVESAVPAPAGDTRGV